MKADLTLRHHDFGHHFPLGDNIPDFRTLAARIAAQTRSTFARLAKALQPVSREEAYLAESQNLADLENRMLELQSRQDRFPSAYW